MCLRTSLDIVVLPKDKMRALFSHYFFMHQALLSSACYIDNFALDQQCSA